MCGKIQHVIPGIYNTARETTAMNKEKYEIQDIATALRKGLTKTNASKLLGCSYKTLYNYCERHDELKDIVIEIKENKSDLAHSILHHNLFIAEQKTQYVKNEIVRRIERGENIDWDTIEVDIKSFNVAIAYLERQEKITTTTPPEPKFSRKPHWTECEDDFSPESIAKSIAYFEKIGIEPEKIQKLKDSTNALLKEEEEQSANNGECEDEKQQN